MSENVRSPESYTEKEKWDSLNARQRVRYLWDYYKLPFLILLIFLYIIGFNIYKKAAFREPLLYVSLVNAAPDQPVLNKLSDGYLSFLQENPRKTEIPLTSGLYLTTDRESDVFEYTYASQVKILAAIDGEHMDVVFMNREAFQAFSQNGYLYNLDELLKDSPLAGHLLPYIEIGTEILEDNAKDLNFDSSVAYESVSVDYPMALDVTHCPVFKDCDFNDTLYLGILANTPRANQVLSYLSYLYAQE